MANEAVIVELLGDQGNVVDFTVADGTAISKGTLLKVADDRTASAGTARADKFAGIAAASTESATGKTKATKRVSQLRIKPILS